MFLVCSFYGFKSHFNVDNILQIKTEIFGANFDMSFSKLAYSKILTILEYTLKRPILGRATSFKTCDIRSATLSNVSIPFK
jgi:hypothetical protein